MAFDIYLLDKLDYDEAEPLLEDYIIGAINQFLASDIGQAYAKEHSEGGDWIGTFLEMAYIYGGFTLPKMTKGNVQEVMEYILPRKLTLIDPSDTDGAIDELVTFWTFLKETYRFRSAGAIAKYLRSIENKFSQWMFDPSRGGMAKSFLMQGMAEGYDMTTQEGVEAFQSEHNQRIRANPAPMPGSPMVPMTSPPPEVQQMFDQFGIELPPAGQPVNPAALLGQLLNVAEQLGEALEDGEPLPPQAGDGMGNLRASMLQHKLNEPLPLAEEEKSLLNAQTITETEPGTILKDFQTVLDFIGPKGIAVSGKLHHISLKLLVALNERLSNPIQIALKRPQQKSYPNIHGLYLLLRATGIAKVAAKGKQHQLVLNSEIYDSWQQLNLTERYCTLLEAWLVRSHPEMLGEERSGPFTEGDRCLQTWANFEQKPTLKVPKYEDQQHLGYWPGLHNLALMEMFGLIEIASGKPSAGKGWRIKRIEALPFGQALMKLVRNACIAADLEWPSATDPTQSFGELQPELQPYFPEWQQTLAVPSFSFRPGRHIFKVSLGKVWRRIAIAGDATLADLSSLILDSVEFDHDHLDQFTYKDLSGRKIEAVHPEFMEGPLFAKTDLSTDAVKIGSLPLSEGEVMEYLFDFGDWWEFQVQLETVEPAPESEPSKGFQKVKQTKRRRRPPEPSGEIIEVHGEAPPQYPDEDEYW